MQPGELRWTEERMFGGKINQNARLEYKRTIENCLSISDLQNIEAGPFGPLLKLMKKMIINGCLVHQALFRQLQTNKKYETWYALGGKPCRFSLEEFRLITGLNCDIPDEDDMLEDKRACPMMFGRTTITIAELL